LAVKLEKQLKSRKTYSTTPVKTPVPAKPLSSFRPNSPPRGDKAKGKGKEVVKEAPNNQKKCFECPGYGHFQADCPNRRVLTIREIKDLDHTEIQEDEEVSVEEGEAFYLLPEGGKMLMIKRVLHANKNAPKANQRG